MDPLTQQEIGIDRQVQRLVSGVQWTPMVTTSVGVLLVGLALTATHLPRLANAVFIGASTL